MSKDEKYLRVNCPKCHIIYRVSSKLIGRLATCKKCHAKFVIPDMIFEEYRTRISKLFKTEISLDFLDSFISKAEDRFAKNKWQLNEANPKTIKYFFENEFCIEECLQREFIKNLNNKFQITINSNQSIVKLVGRVYLVLGMIWLKIVNKELLLTETQSTRIYKILQYFVKIDDFVPDTSVGGYLDDLYISTFAFIRFREDKKQIVMDNLKRELKHQCPQ